MYSKCVGTYWSHWSEYTREARACSRGSGPEMCTRCTRWPGLPGLGPSWYPCTVDASCTCSHLPSCMKCLPSWYTPECKRSQDLHRPDARCTYSMSGPSRVECSTRLVIAFTRTWQTMHAPVRVAVTGQTTSCASCILHTPVYWIGTERTCTGVHTQPDCGVRLYWYAVYWYDRSMPGVRPLAPTPTMTWYEVYVMYTMYRSVCHRWVL